MFLREKIKLTMPRKKVYKLDQIASQMGHEVVILPPYHCKYNPKELFWAQVKGDMAAKNNTFKLVDVDKLIKNALDAITKEVWTKCGEHCNKIQDENLVKKGLRDVRANHYHHKF